LYTGASNHYQHAGNFNIQHGGYFFVSKISTSASGAVGIAFSLMSIIQAIGFTIGMGSGNYISRLLGQKDRDHAARVAATGFFTALIFGAVLAVCGLIFLNPLVYALGATPTIAPYAKII